MNLSISEPVYQSVNQSINPFLTPSLPRGRLLPRWGTADAEIHVQPADNPEVWKVLSLQN